MSRLKQHYQQQLLQLLSYLINYYSLVLWMVQSPNYEVETIGEAQRLYDKIVWTQN